MDKLTKFSPSIAEATKIVEQYKGLKIKDIEDKDGYAAVYAAQQELKKLRVNITKLGKEQRAEALAWQKEVIRQENELIAIISPIEDELKSERLRIDEEKKRQERVVLLPGRKKMMEEIGNEIDDDFLLDMDEKEFSAFYNERKADYLARVERRLQEEREQLERDKREAEEKKQREAELAKAKEEAAAQAKKEAEEKAEREKQEALERAEREKQEEIARIKREQEEKERKEKEEAERKRKEEEEKAELEEKERKKTEADKRYKKWLADNGVTEENKADYDVVSKPLLTGKVVYVLYKRVSEITL